MMIVIVMMYILLSFKVHDKRQEFLESESELTFHAIENLVIG